MPRRLLLASHVLVNVEFFDLELQLMNLAPKLLGLLVPQPHNSTLETLR